MAAKSAQEKEIEELKAKLAAQGEVIASAKKSGQKIASPVDGKLTVKWEDDVTKDEVTKVISFKNGRTKCHIQDGRKVSSEALLKIANGKEATTAETKAFPALEDVTKASAVEILTKYAKMKAGFLDIK